MHKQVDINIQGRDFVVGDIHGCWSLVEQFLEFVEFNTSKDRLFGCGDLVDRGPDNVKCLDLLYQPWYHQVGGNHEEMTVEYFSGGPSGIYLSNGGLWAQEHRTANNDESVFVQGAVLDVMAKLPFIITVPMQNGKCFHIIHAEFGINFPFFDEDLHDDYFQAQLKMQTARDGLFLRWGRHLFFPLYMQVMDGRNIAKYQKWYEMNKCGDMFNDKLSHIYCGHSIVRQPTRVAGQTNLDTGAFLAYQKSAYSDRIINPWAGLTFTEPATDRFWTSRLDGVTETQLLTLI